MNANSPIVNGANCDPRRRAVSLGGGFLSNVMRRVAGVAMIVQVMILMALCLTAQLNPHI